MTYLAYLPFVFQVLSFFDQDFLPQRCDCGEAVTFHVNSLLQYLTNTTSSTQGITEYSLRYFIKDRGIGCVGRQVHFRNRAVQVSAAHIRREWFHAEDMDALDKCTYTILLRLLIHTNCYCSVKFDSFLNVLHSRKFECVKNVLDLVSSWSVYCDNCFKFF